jgi:hypothetical protein
MYQSDITGPILDEILEERLKQVQKWGNGSDDQQTKGQLLDAASAYIDDDISLWPKGSVWNPSNFKSVDQVGIRGQLIRAATLIVAEIERLERANVPSNHN